ncbi:hypothetical protein L6R50_25220 [Myxococcota bacterium]|nr:hypothetical protein [Myxococcota bacterium]
MVQKPYDTTSDFGLKMRYALAARSTGAGAVQSAVVSCTLALELKS